MADLIPAPRPVPSPEDRMRDARQPGPTFATYLDRHDRDQLDARAATAEAERDDTLNDRDDYREACDLLRAQLDTLQPLIAAAKTWRTWYGNTNPSYASACNDLAATIDALPPVLGSPAPRAQEPTPGDARRLLDQAIDTALPLAGLRVAELLDALRRELARVDAGRAPAEEPRVAPFGCDDCSVEHGERHRYADCPTNLRQIERDAARDARP